MGTEFDFDAIVSGESRPPAYRRNFILSYLFQCKEAYERGEREEEGDYVQSLFNAWQRYAERIGKKPGTLNAFKQVLYGLRDEGLIEFYANRPASRAGYWPRSYYRIVVD